jgi:isopenicillin N synthase-like dioxygenase
MDPIKTLDFGNWVSGSDEERQSFAKDLHDELVAVGFVKLCNHGLSNECIDNLFQKVSHYKSEA